MAGIGFRLQKLLAGESYSETVKAYLFSAVIATGPMLTVIISLLAVHGLGKSWVSPEESALFIGMVVYTYAFSMVGSGPLLYIVTRYLSDHYFMKNFSVFTPAYLSALEILFLFQSAAAYLFLRPLGLDDTVKWLGILLYLFVNGTWLAMILLSAARSFLWIVWGYFLGSAVGFAAAWILGKWVGFTGLLGGFVLGQGIIFSVLTVRIFFEFGATTKHNFEFLSYFRKHPYLALVGLFLNLGIWADKFLFWGSPFGEALGEGFIAAPNYDTPMFLAFLTVVPSMAFFLIQMETSFIRHYNAFFKGIERRESLETLRRLRAGIMENITANVQKFVLFQGLITGTVILFVPQIAEAFHLNPYQIGILRIGLLATFLQMAFLLFLNIYFYFDFQKDACWAAFSFCAGNFLFTGLSLKAGLPAYGFGFAGACFLSAVLSFFLLDNRLKDLEYWTFMRQPILVPKFKLEKE